MEKGRKTVENQIKDFLFYEKKRKIARIPAASGQFPEKKNIFFSMKLQKVVAVQTQTVGIKGIDLKAPFL